MHITLYYKYILCTKVAYTNYLTNSLNISAGKTLVFNFSIPFAYLSAGKKLYYNSGLSLNKSIDLTNISL